MLGNIIDHRTEANRYIVNCDVVFEPSWHDNKIKKTGLNSTQFVKNEEFFVEELEDTTVGAAVKMAQERWLCPVTVYIYDKGANTHPVKK